MESEPEKLDLSALAPSAARLDQLSVRIADRAFVLRRFRRVVARRGAVAAVLAAAAAIAFWISAPKPRADSNDILSWAVRDADPTELLQLGGRDAY